MFFNYLIYKIFTKKYQKIQQKTKTFEDINKFF